MTLSNLEPRMKSEDESRRAKPSAAKHAQPMMLLVPSALFIIALDCIHWHIIVHSCIMVGWPLVEVDRVVIPGRVAPLQARRRGITAQAGDGCK